jgi:proteasome lid subunit RPN8/RPN11
MSHNKLIITENTIHDIIEESNSHKNVETGGLLFGRIIGEYLIILKIIHLPSANAKRTPVYFEMDEDFAINITKQMERNNLTYLGNWHKHLGYGGPSNGDDKQAELFLLQNSHKRNYLSLIIDFYDYDYNIIATNYYFNKNEFIKKDLQIKRITNIQQSNKFFNGKTINVRNFVDNLSKNLKDYTGKTFLHSQSNKSRNYKLFYEEIYSSNDNWYTSKDKIVYSVFIKFPHLNISMTDRISIGVTLDRKFTKIVEEILFSDIFFNRVELLPKIKNMVDRSQYYIDKTSHLSDKTSHLSDKTRISVLKRRLKNVFTGLKAFSLSNIYLKEKAKNVNERS